MSNFDTNTATKFFELIEEFFEKSPGVNAEEDKPLYLAACMAIYLEDCADAYELSDWTYDNAYMANTINLN